MATRDKPATPREAYKAIIDEFVKDSSASVTDRLVRESGIYSKAQGYDDLNELVQSLTTLQRDVLARMLREERIGAVASALAELEWWISCRDVSITYRGQPMPHELTENGLHGDFLGRCDGWEWLDKE